MNIPFWFLKGELSLPKNTPKLIVVVGSSGVGKTTAVDPLRYIHNPILYESGDWYMENGRWVVVPSRYITRAPRVGQSTAENINITRSEFLRLLQVGNIFFPWMRDLGGEKSEFYGFESLETIDTHLQNIWRVMKSSYQDSISIPYYSGNQQSVIVLSGNNAVGKKVGWIINNTWRSDTLIVGISLSAWERERRIRERNPEMFTIDPKQMEIRLADPSDKVEGHSHLILENNWTPKDLQTRLALLIREVLDNRKEEAREWRWRFHKNFYPPNIGFSD